MPAALVDVGQIAYGPWYKLLRTVIAQRRAEEKRRNGGGPPAWCSVLEAEGRESLRRKRKGSRFRCSPDAGPGEEALAPWVRTV